MNTSSFFLGLLPLIIFVVLDSVGGLRAGIIAAIGFAVLETAYSLIIYRELDGLSIGSTLLIILFGGWSLRANNPLYMKLQPVVLGLVFGAIFIVMQILKQPLLVTMVSKYQYMLPQSYRELIVEPSYLALLAKLSGVLGFGFLIHASFVAYAAFFLNKWWWLILRGLGLYLMLLLCVLYIRFI